MKFFIHNLCVFMKHDLFSIHQTFHSLKAMMLNFCFTLIVIWYLSLLCSFFLGEFVFQNG